MKRVASATIAAACFLAGHEALAGAWPQEKGHGTLIVTGYATRAGESFDADGDNNETATVKKSELYFHLEHGLTDRLTFIATPSLGEVKICSETERSGLGITQVGARWSAARTDTSALSFQTTYRFAGAESRSAFPDVNTSGDEMDFRVLYGRSFPLGDLYGFAEAQAGYRIRQSQPPNEWKMDLTVGLPVTENSQLLVQTFSTVSDGSGELLPYEYHKSQVSLTRRLGDGWTVQAGGAFTIAGENALDEKGPFLSVWKDY